jgi:hypothetical protein
MYYLIVERSRIWYAKNTGQSIPFMTILHDLCDGRLREVIGLTETFIDPVDTSFYLVPVALFKATSKVAREVAQQSLHLCSRFHTYQTDFHSPMNDTTNSALCAGHLIAGKGTNGYFNMHRAELIIKHATGQVVRKENNQVVDLFEECEALCLNFRKFASWIMSKRAKKGLKK